MILLYPLLLVGALAVALRNRGVQRGRGWRWFGAWCTAGAVFTFSFLSGFSVGLLVLPFAAAALFVVASRAPHLSESIGFVAGLGSTLLLVAFLSRNYNPCPEDGVLSLPATAPPGTSVECGGFDPLPWLVAGSAAIAFALVGYALVRIIPSRRAA